MTNDWVFTATSAERRRVLELAQRVARSSCAVLILGPTGVGKDVLAEDIHRHSARAGGRFVAVNCAAITPTLFESELFGHSRGAFTGATMDKEGLLEVADGGTLFLDEVGELPLEEQAKLLRVLERGTFRRVGALHERAVDVRIIAATNRDLLGMLSKTFREDLFFRLSVATLQVPSLSPEDVRALVHVLARQLSRPSAPAAERGAAPLARQEIEAIAALAQRSTFPGGVRDLRNTLERYLLVRGEHQRVEETWRAAFELSPTRGAPSPAEAPAPRAASQIVRLVDDAVFVLGLREAHSVRSAAARFDISVPTVYGRLKRLRVKPEHVGRFEPIDAALAALKLAAREHRGALQTVFRILLEN